MDIYQFVASALPVKPNVILRRLRAVIFVRGCFWHRHACKYGRATPRTRAAFWHAKFESNIARDRRVLAALRRNGWRVLVIWECQLKRPASVLHRLRRFLEPLYSPL